jgi:hypothetical protein
MVLFIYNTFFKNNTNHYKIKSDNQRKYLNIHNVIKFRNILFDYCNSLNLSELKYEIEKNDFQYINKLLQIKNQIDINYNNKYYNKIDDSEASDDSEESEECNVLNYSDNKEFNNIDNDSCTTDSTDSTDSTDTPYTTKINKINNNDNDKDNDSYNTDNTEINDNDISDNDISDNTEFENIRKELTNLLNK